MPEHRFEFQKGDFVLRLSGERAYVEAMVARYLPLIDVDMAPGEPVPPSVEPPRRMPSVQTNISLLDFIAIKELTGTTDPADLILALTYYRERYEYLPNCSLDDLRPHLPALTVSEAAAAQALLDLHRQNFLVADDGRYSLSFSGEQRVKYGDFPSCAADG
ncbi:MAG: hypothetical protein H7338_00205 [Candidatus Sericytochromatia bacterium]|nr:hypothetical protein [Candidatus Sericytochromatia bacterium]